MTEDFYELLDIPPDASQDEIKDAYREQVRVYHPDLNDDDRARAQFTAVKTAYDILGDPVERQAYDRLGHEDYVAKRTSGLPSPDVWKSDDDEDETTDSSGTELSYSESETASASASASTSSSNGSRSSATGSTSTTASHTASATGSSGTTSSAGASASSASTGTARDASSATGTGTGSGTGSRHGRSGSGASGRTGGVDGTTAGGAGKSRGSGVRSGTGTGPDTGNPIARWWRRQNFSLPMIWLSVFVYAAGIVHFGLENAESIRSLSTKLRAIGVDPGGLRALLSESRHGLATPTAFVRNVELVAPPLEPTLWYGTLAGVVALAVGALVVVRAVRRDDPWGPVTIDETIVVAVALGATTTLIGGPMLAGAVLMPLLFGVVIRHTRRGPGWAPSYLYLLPVLGPIAGFGVAAAGSASLPVDLAAFVILPVVGGLGLPLRATIRKRFDR